MAGLRSWNPFLEVAYFRDLKKQMEENLDPARWNPGPNSGMLGSIPKLIQAPTTPPVQQTKALSPTPALRGAFP
jgi:hypothetical protein